MIVISQSTVCSLRLKKRKGDSNPKGTGVQTNDTINACKVMWAINDASTQ